jgi:AAA ATPase domain
VAVEYNGEVPYPDLLPMSVKLTSEQWKKLYKAFDPFRPLPANDPAWVDCASVRGEEDILLGLGLEIQRSPEVTCQLYAGHRGAGKSTELLRLQDDLQKLQYRVVYFAVDDGDLEPEDTQYSDILLACARQLISQLRSAEGQDDRFREWVRRLVEDLRQLGALELSLEEISYATPEMPLGKVSSKIKTSMSHRNVIRQKVESEADSLIEILNAFIQAALGDRKPDSLLLIVDNLDRIVEKHDGPQSSYEQIFVNHSDQLRGLNCHVIYTVPISLAYSKHLTAMEERYKPVEVLPMVMVKSQDGQTICRSGLDKLKQLLLQRFRMVDGGLTLEGAFETVDGVEKLCEMSGGHVRNLMNLMKAALQYTKELPISDRSVKRAISELRETYSKVIDGDEWPCLVEVDREKVIAKNNDQFRSLLFRRCVLEYRYLNDEGEIVVWHDIHPLIRGLEGFKRAHNESGGG